MFDDNIYCASQKISFHCLNIFECTRAHFDLNSPAFKEYKAVNFSKSILNMRLDRI